MSEVSRETRMSEDIQCSNGCEEVLPLPKTCESRPTGSLREFSKTSGGRSEGVCFADFSKTTAEVPIVYEKSARVGTTPSEHSPVDSLGSVLSKSTVRYEPTFMIDVHNFVVQGINLLPLLVEMSIFCPLYFPCGVLFGACQSTDDTSWYGEGTRSGRWNTESCICPKRDKKKCFPCIYFDYGRNIGSLVHPYRCARMCYLYRSPAKQEMK